MIHSLLARWRPAADPAADQGQSFFQALRYAAGHTRYYSSLRESLPPGDAAAVLAALPRVDLLDYLRHPERFTVRGQPREAAPRLRYPLGDPPRTAVLGEPAAGAGVRGFADYSGAELNRYAPEALAGHADTIRALAEAIARGEAAPPPLRNALVVYTDLLRGPLGEGDRDLFWRTFEVPVFEQFRGFDHEILAAECEIHHGLHIDTGAAWFEQDAGELRVSFLLNRRAPVFRLATNLSGQLTTEACPCGLDSPRLIGLRRRIASAIPYAKRAASAQC